MPDPITVKESRCLSESLAFIRETADRYSLRSFTDMPTDEGVAANVLIGNIAHDRYKQCMASPEPRPANPPARPRPRNGG